MQQVIEGKPRLGAYITLLAAYEHPHVKAQQSQHAKRMLSGGCAYV
jgi:hypothetical protein